MFASGTGAPTAESASCRLCTADLAEANDDDASIELFGDTGQHFDAVHIIFKHYDIDILSTDPHSKRICVSCWRITSDFHELFEQVKLIEQKLVNTRIRPADADVNTEVLTKIEISPVSEVQYNDVDESGNRAEVVETISAEASSDVGSCGDEAMGAAGADDRGGTDTSHPITDIDAVSESENRRISAHFQMSCDQCEQANFRSLVQMNQHCCNEHGTYAFLVCCDQKFFAVDKALAHIDQHNAFDGATHQFDRCDAKFAKHEQLKRHRASVHAAPITLAQTPMATSTGRNTAKSIANIDGNMDIDVDALHEAEDRRICGHFEMACDLCEKNNFMSLVQMNRHCSDEHGTCAFLACDGHKFNDNDGALAHIDQRDEVRLDNATHACHRCDAMFKASVQLKRHRSSVHDAPAAMTKQQTSTRRAAKLIANIDGTKDLHRTKTIIYNCDICSATFDQDVQLRRHRRLEHDVGQRPNSKRPKAATKVNGEPKRCDKCDKSFVNKYVLATHVSRVHDNVFTLMCHVCAKTFKSKEVFENHQRDVHGAGLALPKLQCTICGNWLKHEHSLRNHMARHFQAQQTCTLCGKVVPNENALGNHMRYVHSDRVYKCTMCDKAFKKPIGLKEHLASHTGVDLYACPYCAQTFKSSANMYAHRKKRHLERWQLDREQRLK